MRQISHSVFVNQEFAGPSLGLIVTRQGNILIDSPDSPTECVHWRQEAETRGRVKYLVNTDGHPDHYFGDYFLPGTLIATSGARDVMAGTTKAEVVARVKKVDPDGLKLMARYKVKLPAITFREGTLELHLGGLLVRLVHTGGHSPNLLAIHVPQEKVIFVGDNINWRHKTRLHDADPVKWLASLEWVKSLDVDTIVPGHGRNTFGKEYIEEQASYVRRWVDAVRSAMKLGWTAAEALQRIKCPDPYPTSHRSPNTEKEVDAQIINRLYQYFSAVGK
ncbi:MAG: MBL fold metallo-hydrolase [Chloroflexi bacterium]|nr:MBL fold metallo-hydrolase [Chloroflexota bacterium]